MALNSSDLDNICSGGCAVASCKHEKHGEVYLHGRCHIHSTANIIYCPGLLHVICRVCLMPITDIAVTGIKSAPKNTCHPSEGMYVHYKLMSGKLLIECGDCHKLLKTIQVSRL